ncbi:MAG TPA: hypothetical protein VHC19_21470 [Pirellulales bacterium]|nr:hypothetical protein [Pirellulales bacterium]
MAAERLRDRIISMTPKLTAEQREALNRCDGPLRIEDQKTNKVYFIVDASTLDALQRRQTVEAIREGIADVEAGRVAPLDEAIVRIRANLGLCSDG